MITLADRTNVADNPTRAAGTEMLVGRVAVVIPTYNRARLLERAVASVSAQTCAKVCDVVIVDDGSTDDTPQTAARLGPRVRYLRQSRQGPAAARNAAIDQTRHEFIAFLDSDDVWLPDKIARQLDVMRRYPEVVLVGGPTDRLHRDGTMVHIPPPRMPLGEPVDLAPTLLNENVLSTPAVMVRRSALRPCDRFPESLRCSEDYVFWVRVAMRGPCVFLPEPVAVAAVDSDDSLSGRQDELWHGSIESLRMLDRELPHSAALRPILRAHLARVLAQARDWHYRRGLYAEAAHLGAQSLLRSPWGRSAWEWECVVLSALRSVMG